MGKGRGGRGEEAGSESLLTGKGGDLTDGRSKPVIARSSVSKSKRASRAELYALGRS
jgi:hypothetical protein